MDTFARDRVGEGELGGVEHRPPRERAAVGGTAVDGIAEDRQARVGEVRADLVLPPGLELDLDERRAG